MRRGHAGRAISRGAGVASRAAALALAAALAGCAGTGWPRGAWVHPEIGPEQQRRDEYECERHAVLADDGDGSPAVRYARCMRARGYEPARPAR